VHMPTGRSRYALSFTDDSFPRSPDSHRSLLSSAR
jgi:hypothetical protein